MTLPIDPSSTWKFFKREEFLNSSAAGPLGTNYVLLETPWFGITLSKRFRPDILPFVYNAPCSYLEVVLKGKFVARQQGGCQIVKSNHFVDIVVSDEVPRTQFCSRFSIKRYDPTEFRAIRRMGNDNLWTLKLTGRKNGKWGYVTDDGILAEPYTIIGIHRLWVLRSTHKRNVIVHLPRGDQS